MTTNYNYQKAKIGSLVLPQKQAISHPANLRNETNFYASASQASFSNGSYFVIDIKQKIQEIYNISLLFTVGDIKQGLSFNSSVQHPVPQEEDLPYYHPSWNFWTRIELVICNQVVETLYSVNQFISNQIFHSDEERFCINNSAGAYNNIVSRRIKSNKVSEYICRLFSFCDVSKYFIGTGSQEIQLRVYMNSIENIYTVPVFIENNVIRPTFSGTPNPSLQCSVICESVNLTKSPLGQMKLAELYKQPNHAIFSQIRYGLYSVPVQTKTQRIVLTSITGSISVLMFVVRSTGQAGDSDYLTPWHFAPIKSYEILDQSSSNIIGGQPISSVVQRSLLRKWTKGTYTEEVYGNSTYRGNENNYANVYMWCFSQNPLDSVIKGRPMGNHKFSGNESLVINFDDQTLESPWVIDVFGYSESVLETGANSLNVISL